MANTTDYVKERFVIEPTPRDAGLEMTIKVRAYDNGLLMVNENPMNGPTKWVSALRFIAQGLEELTNQQARRNEMSQPQ